MNEKSLTFAGGCFWGVQAFARRLPGVVKTVCGYANGTLPHPSYEDVCTGRTGHAEAVRILYDADMISLNKLAEELFTILHPTCPSPSQYRSGFYYESAEDGLKLTQVFTAHAVAADAPLTVECMPLTAFYPAEDYHQDYLEHHPDAFCHVDLSRFGA
jgi:peptide methionine sulfoxide reductase msrA/msrB